MRGGTAAAGRVFRAEHGRLIAPLVRRFGDIGIARECCCQRELTAKDPYPGVLPQAEDHHTSGRTHGSGSTAWR
jgi:predicted RNA polymerase sigma factor